MKNDPYFTKAKFDSVCAETGKKIKKGEEIAYYPLTRKVFSTGAKQADELRGFLFSNSWGV